MTTLRAIALAPVLALVGFAGAQAFASQAPPLVANCVDAADGWKIEVLGVSCTTAGEMVRRLAQTAPKTPTRLKGMTCTVGSVGRAPISIRCSGTRGRFLRADAYLGQGKKTPRLELARCPDYVDELGRRWEIRHERYLGGCDGARGDLARIATTPIPNPRSIEYDRWSVRFRPKNGSCGGSPWKPALPRDVGCSGFFSATPTRQVFFEFRAKVKLAPPPSTGGATTTVRRSMSGAHAARPNEAKRLVLQKSDFPRGTVARDGGGTVSAAGSGYAVTYLYRSAGGPRELAASVAVFKSRSVAVEMFEETRAELGSAVPRLTLPRYGEQQVANFSPLGGSRLIVRTGSVVWVLELETAVTRGGRTHELTKAEAIAEYRIYAVKQQRRIAKGAR